MNILKTELLRMLLEFINEIEKEKWFGKERELVSRFVFSKLVKNVGCCSEFFDTAQIGIEVRVKQIAKGKDAVCKDLIIWRKSNQTYWSKENVPLCIMEWKHGNKKPSKYDIDWLQSYTKLHPACFGVALNIENTTDYELKAVLIANGEIEDGNWI
jgi:hypothetical protein